ncbi:MAG: ATP-binding cassette domain-containing protein [Bryobacteraceae bacterium]|nr:ATP-binding cassette domain-containing protein [Bryobacteraceae bacterium]
MIDHQPPLIAWERVSVMRGETLALDGLTLRIGAGEHVAILGPNGCGKSTLIKTITRELYPLNRPGASLSILGRPDWHILELRNLLGIVSNDLMTQCTRDVTGLELVLSGFFSSVEIWPGYHEVTSDMHARALAALERLEAGYLADRYTDEMSSGEARRVLIARALVHQPRAIVFDEPANSLDIFAQAELRRSMRSLAAQGVGIVLVTHHLGDIIPEIDRVVLMKEGRVVADLPKEQALTPERLSPLFGMNVTVVRNDGHYQAW